MKVGVPTEIKTDEYRVALTPSGVRELVEHGHEVVVQAGAGEGSAISDADYEAQGARVLPDAPSVFAEADMTNLARMNREQAEHESARHATTTIARVPFTVWERAFHENWDQNDWNKFLNDPDNRDYRVWGGRL